MTTSTATGVGVRLGHAAVITPDLDRFRRFYEDVLGLRLVVVDRPAEAPFRRMGAFSDASGQNLALLAFEVPGYASGLADDAMGRRGRIDHIAFLAADEAEFAEVTARLVERGASSGTVETLGPVASVHFVDPDGGHRNVQLTQPGWQPGATAEVLDTAALAAVLQQHR